MKKIAIVTDSNAGILPAEAEGKGIFVLPMPFLVNDELYFENINLSQAEFYKLLEENATVSTSQPSLGDLTELWTDLLKEYDEIVHIPMSSGLSQSCASAQMAAKEFDGRVFVVDNHRISVTLKASVYEAAKLREQGKSAAEIKEWLEETAADASIYIAVDTMKYLKKGGRVTPAAATIGSILRLKPILSLQGERLDKYAIARSQLKAKETMKEAMAKDVRGYLQTLADTGNLNLFVAHTNCEEDAQAFVKEIQTYFPHLNVTYCDPLSLSVACHIGPGALAIAAARS